MGRLSLLFLWVVFGCQQKERFLDVPPSNPYPQHGELTDTTAVVFWKTDTPAMSQAEWGSSTNYTQQGGDSAAPSTEHRVVLSSLAPSTLTHYRVRSYDQLKNTLYSYDRQFQTFPPGGSALPARFPENFETSGAQAWFVQTYVDSQAITSLERSAEQQHSGGFSLKCGVSLQGGDPNRAQGEVFRLFNAMTEAPVAEFFSMTGKTVKAWVYAPTGAKGNPAKLNGIQLFIKDVLGRSQYGIYTNIITENTWFEVSLVVGAATNDYTEAGFDPSMIASHGVKIGTGSGSVAAFNGAIYVDDFTYAP